MFKVFLPLWERNPSLFLKRLKRYPHPTSVILRHLTANSLEDFTSFHWGEHPRREFVFKSFNQYPPGFILKIS